MLDNCIVRYLAFSKDYGASMAVPISVASLILSGYFSCLTLSRTKLYQSYEFKIRLQLLNAKVSLSSSNTPGPVFAYSAQLENTGLKPVEIIRIDFTYGLVDDIKKRDAKTIVGKSYLKSGDKININYTLSKVDLTKAMERHGIEQCGVFIDIYYKDHKSRNLEIHRLLGGMEKPNVNIFVLQDGNAIT